MTDRKWPRNTSEMYADRVKELEAELAALRSTPTGEPDRLALDEAMEQLGEKHSGEKEPIGYVVVERREDGNYLARTTPDADEPCDELLTMEGAQAVKASWEATSRDPEWYDPTTTYTVEPIGTSAGSGEPLTTDAVALARLFHETYERLAPSFKYETREESAVPWHAVPEPNKSLMIEVAREIVRIFTATPGPRAEDGERIEGWAIPIKVSHGGLRLWEFSDTPVAGLGEKKQLPSALILHPITPDGDTQS